MEYKCTETVRGFIGLLFWSILLVLTASGKTCWADVLFMGSLFSLLIWKKWFHKQLNLWLVFILTGVFSIPLGLAHICMLFSMGLTAVPQQLGFGIDILLNTVIYFIMLIMVLFLIGGSRYLFDEAYYYFHQDE
ncbi:MAG: hypothetical protein Q4D80_00385 [Pseudomonadota bacterium]|nr:hypothetical protein [Pseudomonadota bacterium]